jgi:antitoxin ParD1/3/4
VNVNVSLTPELEKFVSVKVESGRYNSASEVVLEALRLLEEYEQVRASRLHKFRAEMDRRLQSLDSDGGVDGEKAFERLQQKSQVRRKKRA